jgi:hypothetical protein
MLTPPRVEWLGRKWRVASATRGGPRRGRSRLLKALKWKGDGTKGSPELSLPLQPKLPKAHTEHPNDHGQDGQGGRQEESFRLLISNLQKGCVLVVHSLILPLSSRCHHAPTFSFLLLLSLSLSQPSSGRAVDVVVTSARPDGLCLSPFCCR